MREYHHNEASVIPDSPDEHSDAVFQGSHVWPEQLHAHSSASEPEAPALADHTHDV